jgi:serine/threonine protein kinase
VSQYPPSQPLPTIPAIKPWEELTDQSAASLLALAVSPAPEAEESTLPEIPGYTLLELIGNGGMGAVYRATQDSLGREIALKIISPTLARDPAFAVRFEREARTLASLSHPHIVTIHDAGTTPVGRMFLAMEWIKGTDLARLLQDHGQLAGADALRITRQLCTALHAAHEVGVIHRDVKPSNILLDENHGVKLADFGIALPAGDVTLTLTLTGTSLGTPDYLAPEAFVPGFQPDPRSDVFAAGVTLYQALTGKIPRGRFLPPSALVRGLNPRIDAIIDTALQQDPSRRFPSARAMGEAIAAVESKPGQRNLRILSTFGILTLAALAVPVSFRLLAPPEPSSAREKHGKSANPLPAAATVPTPSLSRSQLREKWLPIYGSASSLNRLSPGVRWDDGWIVPDPAANSVLCLNPSPTATGANWGARATYRWNTARYNRAAATLRKRYHLTDGRSLSEHYLFEVYSHEAGFFHVRQSPDGRHIATPIGSSLPLDLRDDQQVTVEAYVIDGTLYGRVNGTLLQTATDGLLTDGEFDIATYGMPFRDLAFIHLDGLSKEEALQAAGLP